MSHIPLSDCKKRGVYKIYSRNLGIGVFDGEYGFIGIRQKFGHRYLFTEDHYDTGAPYGTVLPRELIGMLPDEIPCSDDIEHEHGNLWLKRDGVYVPVIRRDLQENEEPHGKRHGFVDLWADTGERVPELQFPYLRENDLLFKYLEGLEATPEERGKAS